MKPTIENLHEEKRSFPPSKEFQQNAHLGDAEAYRKLRAEADRDPVAFWEKAAKELHWFQPWQKALEWNPPNAKWFVGGQLNAAYNCLDRHLAKHGDKAALLWEGEDGATTRYTYKQLHAETCRLANALEKDLKLKAGDSVAIYLPLIPEAVIAMLACARLGVTHSVVFAGFSAHALRDRIVDAGCKAVLTCDTTSRRGQTLDLRQTVLNAIDGLDVVKHMVVLRRDGNAPTLTGRELDWRGLVNRHNGEHTAKPVDSEHPLYFLYTSGTTGKPKGIVHTTGGYLTGTALTSKWVFDLKPNDVYWCTADIGWVTGHSYLVYGPLANAATCVIYEGALNFPDAGRIWNIVDKHRVTILYTAPTAIRSFMRAGDAFVDKHKLDSLRLLGSVGEPINPEAWIWYHKKIGKERCPIIDTWWQTETGMHMITPLPGVTVTKPGSATQAFPGIDAAIVDEQGKPCAPNQGGYLVIRKPWPSMLRGIHRNPDRFQEAYWSKFPGVYFTGDGAYCDEQGYFWIMGRLDDVLNVSGHRLGTAEIESALVSHPAVAEAAVVGRPDALKGQAVVAFVTPKDIAGKIDVAKLVKELKEHVAKEIGAIARPDDIKLTKTLPKTRSGKIMRRFLKDLAEGKQATGDTSTLENPGLVELIE